MAKSAKKPRRFARLAILLGLVLALAAGRGWVMARLGAVNPASEEPVTVVIPPGANTAQVAQLLHARGLIQDPTFFRYYVRYRQLDAKIVSGEYALSKAMPTGEILQYLTDGRVRAQRFTVPEGLTVSMVADLLADKGVVARDPFLAAVSAAAARNFYLPADRSALTQPMEGYLFPATYEYQTGVAPEEIVEMMFRRFEETWTEELKLRAKEMNLSLHQVVTLASVVETEAQAPGERKAIAGVYLNRLAINMALQADPTVYYALGLPRGERLLYKHLEVDSPFNTYLYPGLPPGPIAAPGEDAIRAVLDPEQHDYYYFVAKEDGSGEHYFSRTLDEHHENVAKAEANRQK